MPKILAPLTAPASWVYGTAISARNKRFDRGVGVQNLGLPVISVGNITTGGTGKTPMAAWIARRLIELRCEPLIAMRGYMARPNAQSDEQAEYRELLPDPHVVASPDRAAAVRNYLNGHPGVRCVILDDGFQHRQIHRDLDLVLIDAQADTFHDRLLPAGHLREPLTNLKRASDVIVTRAESEIPMLKSQIESHHGRPPLAWARHRWTHVDVFDHDSRPQREKTSWLGGRRVLTMFGVGNPDSIVGQVEAAGARVAVNIPADDHEHFDRAKVATARGLCEACEAMMVTGKDWVKLRDLIDLAHWPVPVVVPRMEIEVIAGAEELRARIVAVVGCPLADKSAR